MSSREARIQQLVANPPVVTLTRWQKAERVMAWVATVIAVGSIVLGVTNLEKTAAQAQCINSSLGERAKASLEQNKAAAAFAAADKAYNMTISNLLTHPPRTPVEKQAALREFKRVQARKTAASNRWASELFKLVRIGQRAPLGRC